MICKVSLTFFRSSVGYVICVSVGIPVSGTCSCAESHDCDDYVWSLIWTCRTCTLLDCGYGGTCASVLTQTCILAKLSDVGTTYELGLKLYTTRVY